MFAQSLQHTTADGEHGCDEENLEEDVQTLIFDYSVWDMLTHIQVWTYPIKLFEIQNFGEFWSEHGFFGTQN